jgi:uncharacterized protein
MIRKTLKICVFLLFSSIASLSWADSYSDFIKAAQFNDASTITSLIRRGMDPNTRHPDGQPVLHLAARDGHLDVVKALVNAGGNVNIRNRLKETAIMLAAIRGKKEIVEFLLTKNAEINHEGWTPLIYAATEGHVDVAKLLIDATVYIDQHSEGGWTALMMAARHGHMPMAKYLVEEGADAWVRNERGEVAWMIADRLNHKDLANYLKAVPRKQ